MKTQHELLIGKVERYLRKLSKPRPEFGGMGMCPSIYKYQHQTNVIMGKYPVDIHLSHVASMQRPLGLVATVVVYDRPINDLSAITDDLLNRRDDIEIFINDPKLRGKYRGVYTGFAHATLVIIQDLATLEKEREWAKTQGYYRDNLTNN